jgi:hypothetical protein
MLGFFRGLLPLLLRNELAKVLSLFLVALLNCLWLKTARVKRGYWHKKSPATGAFLMQLFSSAAASSATARQRSVLRVRVLFLPVGAAVPGATLASVFRSRRWATPAAIALLSARFPWAAPSVV